MSEKAELPEFHNGRSIEEWYQAYCETVVELDKLRTEIREKEEADKQGIPLEHQPGKVVTHFYDSTYADRDKRESVEIEIEGVGTYGFTMKEVTPGKAGWLANVLSRQMAEIHRKSYCKGRDDVRYQLKRALGLGR